MTAGAALVTGAARGIGAAVVRRLVARGYDVHALDCCAHEQGGTPYPLASRRDLEGLVSEHPDRITAVVADVRDPEAMARAADGVVAAHGRLDVVVAGAAILTGGSPLWETGAEQLQLLWETDALGVWHTAHATLPHLLKTAADHPGGAFVAISSAAGTRGLFHLSAYCMAKHAVVGLVKGLAADLRGTGVTACVVAPGSTDTVMLAATASLYDLPDPAGLAESQAVGRLLAPDEVASVVEFACTAGPVVHGGVLAAEGGFGL